MVESREQGDLTSVSPLACDLSALDAAQRRKHDELIRFILNEYDAVEELADGYKFDFQQKTDTYLKIAEWILLEKLCCPFLSLSLALDHGETPIHLAVTGPPGTKQLFKAVD